MDIREKFVVNYDYRIYIYIFYIFIYFRYIQPKMCQGKTDYIQLC